MHEQNKRRAVDCELSADAEGEAFCEKLYGEYLADPEKGETVSLETAAEILGVNLNHKEGMSVRKKINSKIKQRWNTYKRDCWLQECEKGREETEFMLGRLQMFCERLGVSRTELDTEVRCEVMDHACMEFRSRKKKGNKRTLGETDYTQIEMELWPGNLRQMVEQAYLYEHITGFSWTLYEWNGRGLVKVQHVNRGGKVLWLTIRATGNASGKETELQMHLDLLWTNFDELLQFKGLYYSERNRAMLFDLFQCRNSVDKNEQMNYAKWVHPLKNLKLIFEGNGI